MNMLEKTLRWIALSGVFALPFICLVVTSSLFFPYITGKNIAFRLIVEISTAAWLALALVNPAYRPKRSWVLGALAAFVLIIGVADVLGEYAFKSIWSNFERMDGWVTLAHLLAYTVVAASTLQTEKMWRRLFWLSLGVSAYVSLYGLLQVSGQVALGQGGNSGLTGRIDSTFGNPIYMAVYMLFHVFLAAMLWAQQWVEKGHGKRLYISVAYGSIIVLNTITLLLTGTRGTILGLIGGTFVAAFLTLVSANNSRVAWRISAGMVTGLVVLAGGFFLVKDQAWVQQVGFLQRLATISLEDNTTKARFINWSMAWKGVQEKPMLGWGQENYALVFDKYYDPRMYAQEPWFDRVHNIVFDWWVAGGTLGLAAYLSIFAAAMWLLWRPRAGGNGFSVAEKSILTGLLAGYFCHNFFVFDNVTSYILFGTVLAYIAYRSANATHTPAVFTKEHFAQASLPYVAAACAVLLLLTAWYVNQKPLAANRLILGAISSQNNPSAALKQFQEAIALSTYGNQEAREQLAQMTAALAAQTNVSQDIKRAYFDVATTEMQKQAEDSPLDPRFPLFSGVVYSAYGMHEDAKNAYEKALSLSPAKQSIMYLLAENAATRGDSAESRRYYQEAYELDTSNRVAALAYAASLILAGQNAAADELLAPYIERGEAADTRILAAYRTTGQLSRAIPIWQAAIKANPTDAQQYFTLAAIFYLGGDTIRAIQALEEAKRAIPAIADQANPVIEEIRSGKAQVL